MLTDEQAVEMAPRISAMMQTPGWRDYLAVVSDKIALVMDQAIADDPSRLLYHRGSIDGLKAAALSADDVMDLARYVTGEKKDARRRSIASGAAGTFD